MAVPFCSIRVPGAHSSKLQGTQPFPSESGASLSHCPEGQIPKPTPTAPPEPPLRPPLADAPPSLNAPPLPNELPDPTGPPPTPSTPTSPAAPPKPESG